MICASCRCLIIIVVVHQRVPNIQIFPRSRDPREKDIQRGFRHFSLIHSTTPPRPPERTPPPFLAGDSVKGSLLPALITTYVVAPRRIIVPSPLFRDSSSHSRPIHSLFRKSIGHRTREPRQAFALEYSKSTRLDTAGFRSWSAWIGFLLSLSFGWTISLSFSRYRPLIIRSSDHRVLFSEHDTIQKNLPPG